MLGQASRETFKFVEKYAFVGDLAHLHIWDFVMTPAEVRYIKGLCKLMYCGNAVQWTEFRKGTRGAMRMRWPSQVLGGIFLFSRRLDVCNAVKIFSCFNAHRDQLNLRYLTCEFCEWIV